MIEYKFFEWNTFFQMALIYNLSTLFFNRLFTNNKLTEVYPEIFSKFSQIIKILLGFVYYYAGLTSKCKELFIVFAIINVLYFFSGVYWMFHRSHTIKFDYFPLEWIYMRIYGIGDLFFGIHFYLYSTLL
jgi:hypothetical protein